MRARLSWKGFPDSCMPTQNVPMNFSRKKRIFLLFLVVFVNKQAVDKTVAHSNRTVCLRNIKKSSEGLLFRQDIIFHSDHQLFKIW